ncbi:PepSY-associated TM helix domain-containing protein [Foetidibacter luteolus]|uniref:PepSY-associated TM helix domain-containing protein n=1 Tax=Foetidibacter luteolus TaxID=2608880 RepID=UPI00129A22F9|nr:PepSY-associated TM helix domain-containing protein [Foetidibacter luteolus]
MNFKKIILKAHLWLGLASGLIVLFLGITGCILAFEREIKHFTEPYQYVQQESKPFLPPTELKKIALAQLPDKKLHSISYGDKNKAAVAAFYNADPEYYYLIHINPYSGQVLNLQNMNTEFFRVVLMGHFYLWLPPAIGQPIVASATLIFVVMIITGLILWWPKNKAARKQRFTIKWNAKWRRVNYDLHNVLGFYMTWIVIFIALTGLVWGFQWFAKSVYWVTSGGKAQVEFAESLSDKTKKSQAVAASPVDAIWQKVSAENPTAAIIDMHFPETDSSSIEAAINPDASTYWKADYHFYDQYTLKEIPVKHAYGSFKDATVADKIMRMNYDVHVGAILGLPGKILAFCASLIAASLPVTGFVLWWGKKKKDRPAKKGQKG